VCVRRISGVTTVRARRVLLATAEPNPGGKEVPVQVLFVAMAG
jgi:hypothetical protein